MKQEIKKLILNEIEFREQFRKKRKELEDMVSPISKHVKDCCKWWNINLPNALEVMVVMDNGTSLKLTKPKSEDCSVETYLPFGVDFEECEVISFAEKN